jgi:hypothetical protein
MTPTTELLSREEAAARLGLQVVTLDKWRSNKKYRLAYVKVGGRVKYTARSIEEFLASRTVTPGEPRRKRAR